MYWHDKLVKRLIKKSKDNNLYNFDNELFPTHIFDKVHTDSALTQIFYNHWHSNLFNDTRAAGGNKLRTYRLFKGNYGTERYISNDLPFHHRSAFAKFRCGVAPLRLETGRYEGIPLDSRLCFNCLDQIESEMHVIFECSLYNDIRDYLFFNVRNSVPQFDTHTRTEQFCILFGNENIVKYVAKTCHEILCRRKRFLYS